MFKIYNTLSRKKEIFKTKNKTVGVYVCGITPYDVTHLGHAFTYTFFDVVVRYLRYQGFKVTYVQNLTDVDDDILKKAKEVKQNWKILGEKTTAVFLSDSDWLNNLRPDVYPKVTDHIKEIIEFNKKLVVKKFAYVKNGSVYFSVKTFKPFGRLSKLSKKKMLAIANERGNNPDDPNKQNPLDFVLWQAKQTGLPAQAGEPAWPSPWGAGRPGWHIECSAMSTKYLGQTIAIHGGGADLIFPHHECSIAQTEAVTGRQFVSYWLHPAMVRYRGEKMSKNLGNMVLVKDLRTKYSANVIRLYLLVHQYRQSWSADLKDLNKMKKLNDSFKKVWQKSSGLGEPQVINHYKNGFFKALADDFNTPLAIKQLTQMCYKIINDKTGKNTTAAKLFLSQAFSILGLKIEFI